MGLYIVILITGVFCLIMGFRSFTLGHTPSNGYWDAPVFMVSGIMILLAGIKDFIKNEYNKKTNNRIKKEKIHKVTKFWEDSFNIIPFILILIALLQLSCFLFDKRFPHLSILTNFSSISFMFFGLIFMSIAILHAKKPKIFDDKYSSIEAFLTPSLPEIELETSLFLPTLNYLFRFATGLVMAILGCWLVHFFDAIGAWVVIVIQAFTVFFSLRGDKNIILGLLFLCGVPILSYLQGDYYPSAAVAGFVSILVYLAKRKNSMCWLKNLHEYESGIFDLILRFNKLWRNAYYLVYDNPTKINFQALIVSVLFLLYFAGTNIIQLFPSDIAKFSQDLEVLLEQYKPILPYVVCLLYCLFSFDPIVRHLVKPFNFKNEHSSIKLLVNVLIAFFIILCLGPLMFMPVFLMILCMFFVGENIFGADFSLIVGFFVFPEWSARFYAAGFVILLFFTPRKLIQRWVAPP